MDCIDWTASLGNGEVERLLKKIGQSLGFELKHSKEDWWWYETTRLVDGKHFETSKAVRFPESCGGLCDAAFAEPSRLLQAVLQTRIFRVNVHRDGDRWQESHFILNPLFNAKSLEELEITLDLLGEKRKKGGTAENEC